MGKLSNTGAEFFMKMKLTELSKWMEAIPNEQ